MHARIIKEIHKWGRDFTWLSDERRHAISLLDLTGGGRLPPPARSHPRPVHRRRPRRLRPPDATAISLTACCRFADLPPLPPFSLLPLRLIALTSPPNPLCGRILSRSASRRLAYVPCHILRPRMPPHPNPPVCCSWSVSFPPRRALNTGCRTNVAPRFFWPSACM